MKLKKTLALTMAAMAVCASAFAGVSVKSYDVNEDWVKMEVPQVKGAGADVDAKINNALSFNALMQLYSPLPQSDKSADAMLASFEQNFSGKDGVKEAHEFLEDVGGFVNYTLHTDWQAAKALGGSMVDSYGHWAAAWLTATVLKANMTFCTAAKNCCALNSRAICSPAALTAPLCTMYPLLT